MENYFFGSQAKRGIIRANKRRSTMPTVIAGIKVYNLKETAAELGVSYATIKNLRAAGKLKGQRIGRTVMIPEEEIQRFVRGGNGATGASK
jgi:excisionase family DNA binding protein